MQHTSNHRILASLLFVASVTTSCQTLKTGGKVVDQNRKEIILSSSRDPLSALPQAEKDASVTGARERLEANAKENPRDVKTLLSLAELELAQNRLDEAEATCRKALLVDLKNRDARRILAHVSIRRENYKLATIFLTALGGEDSKDSSVLNMLGVIAYEQKDYSRAMRLWKESINQNSGDISARMNLGLVYLKNRLFQKASSQFERVLKIAPAHQDARLHLAIVEASQGRHEKAVEAYEALLSQDRSNQLALFNASVSKKNLAMYDEAISGLKAFIKANREKSTATDAAFAMIEEINTLKSSSGEKVSDDDLQALAKDLAARKSQQNQVKQAANKTSVDKPGQTEAAKQSDGKVASKNLKVETNQMGADQDVPNASDQDIEALERQLKSPAH